MTDPTAALVELRSAIDRAIDALAPLEDVLAAWGAQSVAEAPGAAN